MEMNDYIQMSKRNIQALQARVERDIQQFMKKSDIKVTGTPVTKSSQTFTQRTGEWYEKAQKSEVLNVYEKLSQNKFREGTTQKAIEYSELMFQPTCFTNISLKEGSKELAELKVICTLPEHLQAFANYWIGQSIDSNSLKSLVHDFQNKIKGFNCACATIQSYSDSGRINNIETQICYA
jgi:hypothetical protein